MHPRAPKVAKSRKVSRGVNQTPEQHAQRMALEAAAFAQAHGMPFDISAGDLLPLPPTCPMTLDSLWGCDDSQTPTLALLIEGHRFTVANTVIVSSRARRRHQVIGARALRGNMGAASRLGGTAVAVLYEALERFNDLSWDDEARAIAVEVNALATGMHSLLIVPPMGRPVKWEPSAVASELIQNWCVLIDLEGRSWCIAKGYCLQPRGFAPVMSRHGRIGLTLTEWQDFKNEVTRPAGRRQRIASEVSSACDCPHCVHQGST